MGHFSNAIVIEEYSPNWKLEFEQMSKIFVDRLSNLVLSAEHIGSTAVPGLCAKPVIDIDIVVDSVSELKKIIPILVDLGYQYQGEVSIPDRFVFRPTSRIVPDDGSQRLWLKHHLYCCINGSTALRNHLILRDALRKDELLMNAYGLLKRTLAMTANNMDEYVMGKTSFITKILSQNGMSNADLEAIMEQNKTVIPFPKK